MKPIEISPKITKLSHEKLAEKLEYKAYVFCVTADFENQKEIMRLVDTLEQYSMEAIMRIFKGKLGRTTLQNKIYDNVEKIFADQDIYNINRMFSSLRRAKYLGGINAEDEKYIKWFKNRVKYGVRTMVKNLGEIDYVEVPLEYTEYTSYTADRGVDYA